MADVTRQALFGGAPPRNPCPSFEGSPPFEQGLACTSGRSGASSRFPAVAAAPRRAHLLSYLPLAHAMLSVGAPVPHRIFLVSLKIHQMGVQWKQGVVVYMMLYTSLLHDTTPMHCTPLPVHSPVMNTQSLLGSPGAPAALRLRGRARR